MPRRLYTSQDLVNECRSLLDESNQDSVNDTTDILPALNRGLDYASSLLATSYPDPFITDIIVDFESNETEYEMPEDCFEDRVYKIEIAVSINNGTPNYYESVERVSFYDMGPLQTTAATPFPEFYAIIGRKIRFNRPGRSGYKFRITYMRQPEQIVLPQGRITVINLPGNYVVVDGAGVDLTTETDQLDSYVNICDAQSGVVKWSGQLQLIETDRLTFRAAPTRTLVLNRAIQSALPITGADPNIELDDIVCGVRGSAIIQFSQPLNNYLIEFAVNQLAGIKLGGDVRQDEAILDKFEKQVKSSWGGRETTRRIQNRSRTTRRPRRRIITQRNGG